MLSRALSLATAMLLIGFAAPSSLITAADAQNLEAGKSPAQLFNANCSVCHKSPRGLLKTVAPGQLSGFLRQHYTTSSDMAQIMSAYVAGNGGGAAVGGRKPNDDGLTRQGRELIREQAPAAATEPAPAPEEHAKRRGRKQRPPAETAAPGEAPAAAEAPAERAAPKSNTGKKGRRLTPKTEPKSDARPETDKSEPARSEPAKTEAPKEAAPAKPVGDSAPKPEAKPETPPATRSDPVPQVTPAPKADAPDTPAAPPSNSDAK